MKCISGAEMLYFKTRPRKEKFCAPEMQASGKKPQNIL
jgi:hypothetical protein